MPECIAMASKRECQDTDSIRNQNADVAQSNPIDFPWRLPG